MKYTLVQISLYLPEDRLKSEGVTPEILNREFSELRKDLEGPQARGAFATLGIQTGVEKDKPNDS